MFFFEGVGTVVADLNVKLVDGTVAANLNVS